MNATAIVFSRLIANHRAVIQGATICPATSARRIGRKRAIRQNAAAATAAVLSKVAGQRAVNHDAVRRAAAMGGIKSRRAICHIADQRAVMQRAIPYSTTSIVAGQSAVGRVAGYDAIGYHRGRDGGTIHAAAAAGQALHAQRGAIGDCKTDQGRIGGHINATNSIRAVGIAVRGPGAPDDRICRIVVLAPDSDRLGDRNPVGQDRAGGVIRDPAGGIYPIADPDRVARRGFVYGALKTVGGVRPAIRARSGPIGRHIPVNRLR